MCCMKEDLAGSSRRRGCLRSSYLCKKCNLYDHYQSATAHEAGICLSVSTPRTACERDRFQVLEFEGSVHPRKVIGRKQNMHCRMVRL